MQLEKDPKKNWKLLERQVVPFVEKENRKSLIKSLKSVTAKIIYQENKLRKMKHFDYKADARRKIQMGELIVTAGLDHYHEDQKEILLGILLDAANKLNSNEKETYEHKFTYLGKKKFEEKEKR
jgi:hypothetical protein